nr:magnesium chelatase domain-containing protein [Streptomyces sp. DSM 41633]
SSDLAVAVAIASGYLDIALPMNAVVIGEVGLVGDLRRVTGMDRRLAEAARLGFNIAVVPPGATSAPAGLRVITVDDIGAALRALKDIAIASNRGQHGQ